MMMQDQENSLSELLLERLHDIHAAAEPPWWPPAPGWWLLAAIVFAALAWGLLWSIRKLKVRLRRRRLLRQLEGLGAAFDPSMQPAAYLAAVNRLFRAIAVRAFPESQAIRLEGQSWVAFIRDRLPGDGDSDGLDALEAGPYQPIPEFDAVRLQAQARRWVASYG
jgi:hypothetical protein